MQYVRRLTLYVLHVLEDSHQIFVSLLHVCHLISVRICMISVRTYCWYYKNVYQLTS